MWTPKTRDEAQAWFDKIRAQLADTPEDFYFWRNRPLRDAGDNFKVKPAHQLGIMNRSQARQAGIRTHRSFGRKMVVPTKRARFKTRRSQ